MVGAQLQTEVAVHIPTKIGLTQENGQVSLSDRKLYRVLFLQAPPKLLEYGTCPSQHKFD